MLWVDYAEREMKNRTGVIGGGPSVAQRLMWQRRNRKLSHRKNLAAVK